MKHGILPPPRPDDLLRILRICPSCNRYPELQFPGKNLPLHLDRKA